jgi:hypothetical protein
MSGLLTDGLVVVVVVMVRIGHSGHRTSLPLYFCRFGCKKNMLRERKASRRHNQIIEF